MGERVSNPTFEAIRDLLQPYARHFTRTHEAEGPNYYDLQDERDHARATFADLYPWKGGARLSLSALRAFPHLAATLPASLAPLLKQKSCFDFATITKSQKTALAALFAALWTRIEASREMTPELVFREVPDRETTHAILKRLVEDRTDVTLRETKQAFVLELTTKATLSPVLARRAKNTSTLAFKTITPEEYLALRALLAPA